MICHFVVTDANNEVKHSSETLSTKETSEGMVMTLSLFVSFS